MLVWPNGGLRQGVGRARLTGRGDRRAGDRGSWPGRTPRGGSSGSLALGGVAAVVAGTPLDAALA